MGKIKFARKAPIMDMKGKFRRTGMALGRLGSVFHIKKYKAES